jgi:hypothetical protein
MEMAETRRQVIGADEAKSDHPPTHALSGELFHQRVTTRYISGDRDLVFSPYVLSRSAPSLATAHTLPGGKQKRQLRRQL